MMLSTAPEGTRQNDSGAQRMENHFYFVGAGAVADPGRGVVPLPWGIGQDMSPGAPAGEPFWPRKGHSIGVHFCFKRAWYTETSLAPVDSTPKVLLYTRKQ